jgi:hypothetical protein
MKPPARPFSALLPVAALTFSLGLLFELTALNFYSFKVSAHGSDSIYIGATTTSMVVQSNGFLSLAFTGAALLMEKPITILNVPAHFVDALISYAIARQPFWSPISIGPAAWHCLTYPFFALPAWFYVGFGLDAFLGRKRVRPLALTLSVILALAFGVLASGLRFGKTPEERQEQDMLPTYIGGLALWAVLFAVPFAAWLRQRIGKPSTAASPLTS